MKKFALAAVLVFLLPALSWSAKPSVIIMHPANGWSSERIVHITGAVGDSTITRGVLVINGNAQEMAVGEGRFDVEQVMSPGQNTIRVIVENSEGIGTDTVTVYSKVPQKDMKVVLTWDTNGTDVDMWVTDPNQEKCFYDHRETQIGARLDVDDTDGYGPETFTLARAVPGQYLVQVNYYSDHGQAATRCKAAIILYEGTPREWRKEYEFTLFKSGDIHQVDSIVIEPGM